MEWFQPAHASDECLANKILVLWICLYTLTPRPGKILNKSMKSVFRKKGDAQKMVTLLHFIEIYFSLAYSMLAVQLNYISLYM